MKLREIIDLGKITSLNPYALKEDDHAMITLLNFALSEVYNRIPQLTQHQHIHLVDGKFRYDYLEDSYKIIEARDECGRMISINDHTSEYSMFDMGNHVIDIPVCLHNSTNDIALFLHMKPPKITCENIDTLDFTPDDALVSAILSHMTYMVGKGLSENDGIASFNEFVQKIDEVKRLGLGNYYTHDTKNLFYQKGFV